MSNQLKLCRGEEVGGPKVREPRWFLAVIPFRGTGGPPTLRSAYQMVSFKYTHAIDDLSDRNKESNKRIIERNAGVPGKIRRGKDGLDIDGGDRYSYACAPYTCACVHVCVCKREILVVGG